MSKVKETPEEKSKRKAASTPESRYQGLLNSRRTYALHKATAKRAAKRRNKKVK